GANGPGGHHHGWQHHGRQRQPLVRPGTGHRASFAADRAQTGSTFGRKTMKRLLLSLVVFIFWARFALALDPAADPALATVRIKSHGASATIIASTEGRSWLLG